MIAELLELSRYRLDRDFTYRQLADDMERRGFGVPFRTLFALLNTPQAKPYDRTIHKIRQYLADVRPSKVAAR